MASPSSPPVRYALPNFRASRLIGFFNVIFGVQILICGLGFGLYMVTLPLWGNLFSQLQAQAQAQFERTRQAEIAAIEEQEKTAKTVEEKAELAVQKKFAQARVDPTAAQLKMMDMNKMGFVTPATIAWSWVEVLTGLVLNVTMIASGIGLLTWKSWARKLGVWTAALKVLRLFLLWGFFIFAIVPGVAQGLGNMVGEVFVQQQASMGRTGAAAPPPEFFVRVYTIFYSLMGAGYILAGSVYPAVMIWGLTRPGVKAACSGVFRAPKEPNQPC